MKKFCLNLSLSIYLLFVSSAWATDLSDELLRLFQSSNRNVSFGAMLVANQELDSDGRLEEFVKASLRDNEPPVDRLVKLFYLARVDSNYLPAFLEAFPEEPALFNEVLLFDSSLTRTVSGLMVQYVVELTDCRNPEGIREAARKKALRLQTVQDLSGWSAEIFPGEYPECPIR